MTQVEQSRECGAGGDAREGCHLPHGTGKRCWLLASPHLPSPYPLSCFFTHHPYPFKFRNACGVNSICSDGDSQRRCLSEGKGSPALHTMLSVKHPSLATTTRSPPAPLSSLHFCPLCRPPGHPPRITTFTLPSPQKRRLCALALIIAPQVCRLSKHPSPQCPPCYSAAKLAGSPSRGDRAREKPLYISKKKKKGRAFMSCQAALAGCVLMDIPLLCQHLADPSRS